MLKGGFVDVQQTFFRVFRLTKLTVLLAFTIAGYNVECIHSFNARKIAVAEAPRGSRTTTAVSCGSAPEPPVTLRRIRSPPMRSRRRRLGERSHRPARRRRRRCQGRSRR